jgi:acetyl-CoA C-acetyltransferase
VVFMRRVAVVGVGHSRFGRRDDALLEEIAFEAFKEAVEDTDNRVSQKDIDLVVVGSTGTRHYEGYPALPVAEYLGLAGKPLIRVEAACATGSAAVFTAYNAIASGLVDTAIAIGVEKMTEVDTPTSTAVGGRGASYLWEFHMFGTSFAAYYALFATAHMARFGTTEEDLALVAVKNHRYGAMNPKAHFQREITVEEALKSRVVAWPLKLYDCCPISDGAAAVILASEGKVRELGIEDPVWIEGVGVSSDTSTLCTRPDYVGLQAAVRAAQMAYKQAKVEPKDIELAEVHDCFTIAEIMAYEDLGFCRKGEGARMIREGETYIGGRIPVNVDGGLKAKGHPLGATGCSMVYEITKQLRHEVKPSSRQVPFKKYTALTHNVGGHGWYAYVMIFRR